MYGILGGLRVIEGASFVAGPVCGQHLLELGAEVIRFDAIGGGPDAQRWPVNHVLPAWDLITGAYTAFALLAAERRRLATGAGASCGCRWWTSRPPRSAIRARSQR